MTHTFSLGIDLGTTNSAVALAEIDGDDVRVVEVTQITGPNQVDEKLTLPSALYLPHRDEFPVDAITLPWMGVGENGAIIGQFARDHGALVPDRLITSAKSWLSNSHIDPHDTVLPWGSTIEEEKLSAIECSRRYLEHLKHGFLNAERLQGREWDLAHGQVVLTVPASFDDVARTLTAQAAQAAGLGAVTLLEEPQAAFYSWTAQTDADWRTQIGPGDIVLVCDVGGGTADFSLIAVTERNGLLELERISVGEHILLGGDNMDLALAYTLRARLEQENKSIDDWQFLALVHAAARGKETLLEDANLGEVPIALPSRGASLFARTVSTVLDRATMEAVLLEGFFPLTGIDDLPHEGRRTGLQEFGLPFASDPVVSKHLARFLTRSLVNVQGSEALSALVGARAEGKSFVPPSAVLFNGGVFNPGALRQRVVDLLTAWNDGEPVRELEGARHDLAVARGAAIYGRTRASGKGIRVKAGAARSYYIGLETSMPAIPGFVPPVKGLCVVPQGMEEGSQVLLEGQRFGLVVGEPAEFRFFSSEVRSGDQPGDTVANAVRDLEETSMLEVHLPQVNGFPAGQAVPVQINTVITELGTLELWMKHESSNQRWKVEFTVRTK
jgi:hypothetical protein